MKGKLETPRTDEAYCDAMRSLDGGSSIAIDQMRAQAQQLERELYLREISWKLDIEAWDRDRKWWHEQLASSERRCAELRELMDETEAALDTIYRHASQQSSALSTAIADTCEEMAEKYRAWEEKRE